MDELSRGKGKAKLRPSETLNVDPNDPAIAMPYRQAKRGARIGTRSDAAPLSSAFLLPYRCKDDNGRNKRNANATPIPSPAPGSRFSRPACPRPRQKYGSQASLSGLISRRLAGIC
jgi:hypothetical protein